MPLTNCESSHPKMYAFVHIEKAAGTTLIHVLRRSFFLQYADVRPLSKDSQGLFTAGDLEKYLKINPFIKCIGGHSVVPFNGLETSLSDIRYFTVLRDPVKRYISQYEYTVQKRGKKMSFEEFLDWELLWDSQTKKIAGVADAKKATELLNKKFMVVGIAEQFDLFLATLKIAINTTPLNIVYASKNVGKATKHMANYDLYKDRIIQNNTQDIELYTYCKNVLIPEQTRILLGSTDSNTPLRPLDRINLPDKVKPYIDFVFRKLYMELATGALRKLAGLPPYGSY